MLIRNWRSPRAGGMLLGLMIGLVLMNILLSIVVPRADQEVKRRKEAQLRFVQAEVRRASEKFMARHHRPPTGLGELVRDADGQRYLRRLYADPMTKSQVWDVAISPTGCSVFSRSEEKSLSGRPYHDFR